MGTAQDTAQGVIIFLMAVYFAPTIVALLRGHLSSGSIIALNVLLGWTLLGWIVALVWSFTGNTKANLRAISGLPPAPKPLDWLVGYKPPQQRIRVIEDKRYSDRGQAVGGHLDDAPPRDTHFGSSVRREPFFDAPAEQPSRLVVKSTGEALDALAAEYGVKPGRQLGEVDQDFRVRIMRVVNPHGVWIAR